jgi:hypothetical protein
MFSEYVMWTWGFCWAGAADGNKAAADKSNQKQSAARKNLVCVMASSYLGCGLMPATFGVLHERALKHCSLAYVSQNFTVYKILARRP